MINLRVFSGLGFLEIHRVDVGRIRGLGGLHLQLRKLMFTSGKLASGRELLVGSLTRDEIAVNLEVFWRALETLNCKGNDMQQIDYTFM